jgi:hypothetical protein
LEYSIYLESKNINILTFCSVHCAVTDKQTSIAATDMHATIDLLDATSSVWPVPRLYSEQNAGFSMWRQKIKVRGLGNFQSDNVNITFREKRNIGSKV